MSNVEKVCWLVFACGLAAAVASGSPTVKLIGAACAVVAFGVVSSAKYRAKSDRTSGNPGIPDPGDGGHGHADGGGHGDNGHA